MALLKISNSENLIKNGTFDQHLGSWSANRVTPADGRARFVSSGRLSQAVELPGAGSVKVTFNIPNSYGPGGVLRLSSTATSYAIGNQGPYELSFIVERGANAELTFTSGSNSYDLDDVELYFDPAAECTPVQLIKNGNFDNSSLLEWEQNGMVKGVDGRAQFDNFGSLFQHVAVKAGASAHVKFKITNYYGEGQVSIPEFNQNFNFSQAGTYEAPFTPEQGSTVTDLTLKFTSIGGTFDLDDVELLACPAEASSGGRKTKAISAVELLPIGDSLP
ncbi:hypothetical protein [Pseudomonas sp. SWRI154]|uniref:hypothetical protein n=1 Tax=Pseudomonas sp. SWRI154 TaxID=2745501 RepID=UPI0016469B7A|nr:hypothetical protein [Pseudomonas sp. SWRI154]MBC3363853.1 hypothetical protein [Pseudomonas sp. SWRI154]